MFNWDEIKREKVLKNHKVDFAKIEDIFEDPLAIYFADDEHSTFEEIRNGVIGKTAQYGLTVLYFTLDAEETRFITARRAERWMVRIYEKQRYR